MSKDVVVFGNLLLDDIVFGDGSTRMGEPGGAAIYSALGARVQGMEVGLVSIVGTDYPDWALAGMARRGIDLAGVHPLGRPGIRIWLLYEDALRQFVHRRERPRHVEVSPGFERMPGAWRSARAFVVSPMPFETQRALVEELSRIPGAFVALDPLVPVKTETWNDWRELAGKVDAFFASEDELRVGNGSGDHLKTLQRLAGGRLRYVAFKRSARGGILYDAASDSVVSWEARADKVVDPTGAGDAFAAGTVAGLLRGESAERALRRGLVSTSFVLEDWGPRALLQTTTEAAEARLKAWFPE